MKRLRGSQWLVAAALLLAAACGAEAPSTAPDTSAPHTTVNAAVAVVPTTMATTTTTAPPPDPAECERAYSELVAEETERLRALLSEQAEGQTQRVKASYAQSAKALDDRAAADLRSHARQGAERATELQGIMNSYLASMSRSASSGSATIDASIWALEDALRAEGRAELQSEIDYQLSVLRRAHAELALDYLLQSDDLAAERVAELMRPWLFASHQLTDWFIDFTGTEGLVAFERRVAGCVCNAEISAIAGAQSDRVRAFLADESARQSAALRGWFDERSSSFDQQVRDLTVHWPQAGLPRLEVQQRSDQIASEFSEAVLQVSEYEFQRHADWYLEFHSPEGRRALQDACNVV